MYQVTKDKRMNKLYFIVNTNAKTGKAGFAWHSVCNMLKERHIPFEAYETKYEGHATELAREISGKDQKEIYLIAVGGDGTMNEVLNGITDFEKVRFGMIPSGSGNDFGRGLWIAKNPKVGMHQILKAIAREQNGIPVTRVDLGLVRWGEEESRIFGISSGIGLDAIVCKKALHSKLKKVLNKIHLGKLTYLMLTVFSLFTMKTAEVTLECGDSNRVHKMKKMIFAAAMNLRAEGGGVPMAPKASPTDGMLSLSMAHGIPKFVTFFCLPLLVAAKHEGIKGFTVIDAPVLRLHADQPLVLHADGEYCGDVTDVEFVCLSGKLKLLR